MRKTAALLLIVTLLLAAIPLPINAQGTDIQCLTDEAATVVVSVGVDGLPLQLAQEAAAEFMASCPNITIELLETTDIAADRLGVYQQAFEAGSPDIDVVQIDVVWPGILAEHLLDLSPYLTEQQIAAHFPVNIQNNTVNGSLVAIPWFTDAGLLYYRVDLLQKYGFSAPPATWDELANMAQIIMDGERAAGNTEFYGYVWQGNAYEGLTSNALEWQFSETNTQIVNPDTGAVEVLDDATIDTFERAASWVGTISTEDVTRYTEEDARVVWQAGNAAFMRNRSYAYSLGNSNGSPIAGLFAVAPLPAGASGHGAATLGGWQIAVSKYTDTPEAAAAVAIFMTSYNQQKQRAIVGGYSPSIAALYEDSELLESAPFIGGLYDVFANTVARPSTITAPHYDEVSTLYYSAIHSILTGEEDAAVALELLELDLNDILAQ